MAIPLYIGCLRCGRETANMAKKSEERPWLGQRRARGYVALALIIFVLTFLPPAIRSFTHRNRPLPMEDSVFSKEVAALSDSLTAISLNASRQTHRNYYRANGLEPTKETAARPHDTATYYNRHPKKEFLRFELNAADSIDLEQLYGIGPTFARRIIRYRNRLGGFVRIEQLKEVYGMTVETYEAVAPHLSVGTASIKRINPNTASLQQLKAHPYLDYYQARAIVSWREKGHKYSGAEDLRPITLLDDSTIAKIAPYLEY